ncbi:MAG: gliding motility protein GldL [Paludibacteraceae bacterium]|nr:gliding motility protein GldL [Paludibacteraceae bacterium]
MSQEKRSGFMGWYESYGGKKVVNMVYCLGASVVIIGALFKILHWPGASQVLMVGMFTEAFLFGIGCLDKPHVDFHWEEVFPQLLGYGAEPEKLEELAKRPKPTLLGGMGGGGVAGGNTASASSTALSDKDMEALKSGINDLAKTAVQLGELGKMATTTNNLTQKLEAAGQAAEQFAHSATQLGQQSETLSNTYATVTNDMQSVVEQTREYQRGVANLGDKLGQMNTVYDLQLAALQQQSEQVKAATAQFNQVAANVQKMTTSSEEAMRSHAAYEEGVKKLATQVTDLNKIYGNMLTALA